MQYIPNKDRLYINLAAAAVMRARWHLAMTGTSPRIDAYLILNKLPSPLNLITFTRLNWSQLFFFFSLSPPPHPSPPFPSSPPVTGTGRNFREPPHHRLEPRTRFPSASDRYPPSFARAGRDGGRVFAEVYVTIGLSVCLSVQ